MINHRNYKHVEMKRKLILLHFTRFFVTLMISSSKLLALGNEKKKVFLLHFTRFFVILQPEPRKQ